MKEGILLNQEEKKLNEENHYINIEGERIYYNGVIKNPEFKTLILVHGAGSHADSWNFVTSKFDGDFNYIAIDLPGHYRSSGEAKMSISDNADFINFFVVNVQNKYKLKNAFIYVGHSLGGAIGVEVSTRNYSWLDSTILIATSSDFTEVTSQDFLDKLKHGKMDLDFYKNGFSPSTPSTYYEALVSRLGAVDLNSVYCDFYATSKFTDTDILYKIKKKTLIISANDDMIMPTDAGKILATGIPNNEWVEIQNAGHFVVMEQPALLVKAIQEFIS